MFYDFERIRRELIARGHRFSTESDSEKETEPHQANTARLKPTGL
jgi:hypothetical protein